MVSRLIERGVNLLIGNVSDLFGPQVQECLELLGDCCAIFSRRDLLGRNGYYADFLIGVDRPAQQLLDSSFHVLRQLAGPLDRDVLHFHRQYNASSAIG
jgi:hypothetical protein